MHDTTSARTLVDITGERLLQYIADHDLRPGDALPSETELGVDLGVSRGVMREALSRLRMLGMLDVRTKRGMVLAEPQPFAGLSHLVAANALPARTERDLTELRVMLEIGLAVFAFERRTPEAIDRLAAIVEAMRAATDWQALLALDTEFHAELFAMTGNAALIGLTDIMASFFRRRWDETAAFGGRESHMVTSHAEVVAALRGDDRAHFMAVTHEHVICHVDLHRGEDESDD
jgi:DNA-binding FadR family transcriptional regulator